MICRFFMSYSKGWCSFYCPCFCSVCIADALLLSNIFVPVLDDSGGDQTHIDLVYSFMWHPNSVFFLSPSGLEVCQIIQGRLSCLLTTLVIPFGIVTCNWTLITLLWDKLCEISPAAVDRASVSTILTELGNVPQWPWFLQSQVCYLVGNYHFFVLFSGVFLERDGE